MRILIADNLYDDFLRTWAFNESSDYETELQKLLRAQFGTFDCYSRGLRALGHECVDVICNAAPLQAKWAVENHAAITTNAWAILQAQIEKFVPDCIFLQDLSIDVNPRPGMLIAAQVSCAFEDARAKLVDCIFTSIPSHIPRIEALGVKAQYLPLAFDPIVLEGPQPERDIDISLVGGVGHQWKQGADTLEAVAQAFGRQFHWFGYGVESLPKQSALRGCYRGQAFGRDMYSIYRRSKIVLNRHGEVSQGYANNLRMFEATGCGAMLLSDNDFADQFTFHEVAPYSTPQESVSKIRQCLDGIEPIRLLVAANGQARTLRDHTYAQRMKTVSDTLLSMLCPA